jgi:Protein of unknown function (DUF4242)
MAGPVTVLWLSRFPQSRNGGLTMPLFMDVHEALPPGASAADVAHAHQADLGKQDQYGVRYLKYWVAAGAGKVFCLVEAPDAGAAVCVHRVAHGLVADRIYEVEEGA